MTQVPCKPRKSYKARERKPLDMNNLPHGLQPEEAAAVLGLSESGYYRHIRPAVLRGDILHVRVGRNIRIVTASLLAWWQRQAVEQQEML